uniref:30S ribosomal protein S8, chloroplastic n=1 Tax=Paramoeba aestuarina TaxID=180227 RepID=A0A7S4N695_9EUKA|mmetsp:Transcript_11506/g.17414  ORF Transcript_11506/g.17414 Transcript_11506/m.17414 type:complete len:257 (+) Transcript_11506:30-800(+)
MFRTQLHRARIFNLGEKAFNAKRLSEYNDKTIRRQKNSDFIKQNLTIFTASPEEVSKHTDLPGVTLHSELPADPITRLFFQVKGDCAIYQSSYEEETDRQPGNHATRSTIADPDRPRFEKRTKLPVHDMAGRIMEGQTRKKRFVTVPATNETKGIAKIMEHHGVINGMRDFNNRHAFVVELKYYMGSGVLQYFQAVRDNLVDSDVEWSPLMLRSMARLTGYGHTRIVCVRTWNGRVLDQFQARSQMVGGTGLASFF